jgi:Holliday junction resolvase RusA-like endonuclease
MTEIRFFVTGTPAPGGSKQAFVPLHPVTKQPYRSKLTGRIVVNVIDDAGKRNKAWRQDVAAAALQAMKLADSAPLTGAVELELIFQIPRPKSHFLSDGIRLRPGSPETHITRPDLLKLARSTEDSMTGICYLDDGQIEKETLEKFFSPEAGCWVVIRERA